MSQSAWTTYLSVTRSTMQQQDETKLAVKVQDKKHYDRLTKFLEENGFHFNGIISGQTDPATVWERFKTDGQLIKVLVVETDTSTIWAATKEILDANALDGWDFLSTEDFKKKIQQAVVTRGLSSLPKSYRLLKDTPNVLAGAVFTLRESDYRYVLSTPEHIVVNDGRTVSTPVDVVEQQPEWFQRVYQLNSYVTAEKYVDIQEQLKNGL